VFQELKTETFETFFFYIIMYLQKMY